MHKKTALNILLALGRISNGDKCHYNEKYAAAREVTVGEIQEALDKRESMFPSPSGMMAAASMGSVSFVEPIIARHTMPIEGDIRKRIYQELGVPAHLFDDKAASKMAAQERADIHRYKLEEMIRSMTLLQPSKGYRGPLA